jgi:hypothetical protein
LGTLGDALTPYLACFAHHLPVALKSTRICIVIKLKFFTEKGGKMERLFIYLQSVKKESSMK